ncbi:MAG: DUF1573 domain-containing protein [Rikenellaceae bacterium]
MKRAFYIFICVALCAVLCSVPKLHAEVVGEQGALLHCDSMSHDFGVVNRREGELRHRFVLENRGDEPLIITNIVASCSCMKHSISRKPLAVGEQRELRVTYELKKMPIGRFSKSLMIYSTSRDKRPMVITVSGRSSHTTRKEYKGKGELAPF